jgi:Tol biopolymer transport system component/tRNA A-37 threonylcarbamoyl transferase component Bud32
MSLSAGTRLGPYEILAPLGEGGMGEVYRARDTRLNRDVAIKVLPPLFADDPERLARFEREAQVLAQLHHPNIASIFGLEESGGVRALVMELVAGEGLDVRIARGAIPIEEALPIGLQIAEGLEAAHERGIVHRDLKPGNVKVRPDGTVKVLDFGLAKAWEEPGASTSDVGLSPTITGHHTRAGVILGTAAYMSPEQARGKPVDKRADIWAFGCLLYEMLTGTRLFAGETISDTLAAVLRQEVDWAALPAGLPPSIRALLARCLERDPKRRLRDIGEARVAIEEGLGGREGERLQSAGDIASDLRAPPGSAVTSGPAVAVARGRLRPWLVSGGAVAVAVALGVAGLALYREGERAERHSGAGVAIRRLSFRPQTIFQAAFMPDGETIVYSAALEGNVPELFTIRPEYPEPRSLGLPKTHLLSISSKGELAVLTNARFITLRLFTGTLARVSLGGAAPREILENVRQADWSPDGAELAIIREANGKDRLEFPIGKVLYETAGYLSDLRVLPRGERIALFEHPAKWDDRGSVIVVDRAGKRTVLSGEYSAEEGLSWTRTGDEVLFTASTAGEDPILYAVDLSGHRRVALSSAGGLTMHDVSRAGRWLVTRDDRRNEILVLPPGASAERDLSWLDYSFARDLSPDGHLLLLTDQSATGGPNYGVCLRTTDGGPVVRLGEGDGLGFSPDSKWALAIVYTPPQLVIYPTGPGETRHLARGNLDTYQTAGWFPDGKNVLVVGNEAGKASRCYAQDISGGLPRPVTPEATTSCSVSPDGQEILYWKVGGTCFIQRTGGGPPQAVPGLNPGDSVIRWSADGRGLYLFRADHPPYRFDRLDLASGRRDLIREVVPADRTGVLDVGWAALTDDTKSYAYSQKRLTSQLFVVEGAR